MLDNAYCELLAKIPSKVPGRLYQPHDLVAVNCRPLMTIQLVRESLEVTRPEHPPHLQVCSP